MNSFIDDAAVLQVEDDVLLLETPVLPPTTVVQSVSATLNVTVTCVATVSKTTFVSTTFEDYMRRYLNDV